MTLKLVDLKFCPRGGELCAYSDYCSSEKEKIDNGVVLEQTYGGQQLMDYPPEVVMVVAEEYCVDLRIDRLAFIVRDSHNNRIARDAETVAEGLAQTRLHNPRLV